MKKIKTYDIIRHFVLSIVSICCIVPFLLLIIASLSSETSITLNGYTFFPSEWSLEAYEYLFKEGSQIIRAYGVTIFVTFVGTSVNMLLTTMLAYPLSRKGLPGRKALNFILFFSLLFNGGMVPSYILWTRYLHVGNTIWALILPNLLMNAFYVIMTRSYYQSTIPEELCEAAQIDGANELQIYWKVVMPLSKPILVTVGLFVGLAYWNDWTNGLIYVTGNESINTIQMLLNKMMDNIQFMSNNSSLAGSMTGTLPTASVRMAIAVAGVIPILIIYPFLQKYFVKGIAAGAVKG